MNFTHVLFLLILSFEVIMIELTHLKIIKQVDNTGTLTEAAQKLFLTQSALSHAIKKLEGQLNISIWKKKVANYDSRKQVHLF